MVYHYKTLFRDYEYTAYQDKWRYSAIKQWFSTKLRQVPPLHLSVSIRIYENSKILNDEHLTKKNFRNAVEQNIFHKQKQERT